MLLIVYYDYVIRYIQIIEDVIYGYLQKYNHYIVL